MAQVVNIVVVSTDGKTATADVTYENDNGREQECRVEFTSNGDYGTDSVRLLHQLPFDLVGEVMSECREACKAQRDVNRELN